MKKFMNFITNKLIKWRFGTTDAVEINKQLKDTDYIAIETKDLEEMQALIQTVARNIYNMIYSKLKDNIDSELQEYTDNKKIVVLDDSEEFRKLKQYVDKYDSKFIFDEIISSIYDLCKQNYYANSKIISFIKKYSIEIVKHNNEITIYNIFIDVSRAPEIINSDGICFTIISIDKNIFEII